MTQIFLMTYAVLMLGGGIMGYVKAKSTMSLIMGIISMILIFLGLFVSQSNMQAGFCLIATTSTVLVATFIVRWIKTKKFMPSGMLVALSLIAVALCVKQLLAQ